MARPRPFPGHRAAQASGTLPCTANGVYDSEISNEFIQLIEDFLALLTGPTRIKLNQGSQQLINTLIQTLHCGNHDVQPASPHPAGAGHIRTDDVRRPCPHGRRRGQGSDVASAQVDPAAVRLASMVRAGPARHREPRSRWVGRNRRPSCPKA
jgi:hypothetical protein